MGRASRSKQLRRNLPSRVTTSVEISPEIGSRLNVFGAEIDINKPTLIDHVTAAGGVVGKLSLVFCFRNNNEKSFLGPEGDKLVPATNAEGLILVANGVYGTREDRAIRFDISIPSFSSLSDEQLDEARVGLSGLPLGTIQAIPFQYSFGVISDQGTIPTLTTKQTRADLQHAGYSAPSTYRLPYPHDETMDIISLDFSRLGI